MPTTAPVPRRRPYTVHVSDAIEYQGWVLATDADDADDEARCLLDDGGHATGRGHLDLVRPDRDVMANDAAEVCWRCRTDPSQPNPACPHPPPGGAERLAAHAAPQHAAAAVTFDATAVHAWLDDPSAQYPGLTNAEARAVDGEDFGRGDSGFLAAVEDVLHAWPSGLVRRADVIDVLLWLIPDDEVPDQGALITVDLADGVRLATQYQDIKAFADGDVRGIAAVLSALSHIATQASMVVDAWVASGAGRPATEVHGPGPERRS